jgi:hypothetical protein
LGLAAYPTQIGVEALDDRGAALLPALLPYATMS